MSKEMFLRTKEAKVCLNCNHLEMLDICVSLKDFGIGKDCKLSADVFSYKSGDEIDMHCSKCKNKNTVLIDTKIAYVINILNYKGYKKENSTSPIQIFKDIASKEYISIHGPEHHILDGASILVAYKNAGGNIDIDTALDKLMYEGLRMPGAMCGLWGICGVITSIGVALSIIDRTGPLSTDGTWGNHMQYTSKAIGELGKINGPRCCKRDAMIAFKNGIEYINSHYSVTL